MNTKERRTSCVQYEKKGVWNIQYAIIPSYIEKEEFFNKDEYKLYLCLKELFKNTKIDVFPEVALNQIIKINTQRHKEELYKRYCDRSVDFMLYDLEKQRIYCCIELNGTSHNMDNRKERDTFLKETFEYISIPLIFIKTRDYYKQEDIKEIILSEIEEKERKFKELTNKA